MAPFPPPQQPSGQHSQQQKVQHRGPRGQARSCGQAHLQVTTPQPTPRKPSKAPGSGCCGAGMAFHRTMACKTRRAKGRGSQSLPGSCFRATWAGSGWLLGRARSAHCVEVKLGSERLGVSAVRLVHRRAAVRPSSPSAAPHRVSLYESSRSNPHRSCWSLRGFTSWSVCRGRWPRAGPHTRPVHVW